MNWKLDWKKYHSKQSKGMKVLNIFLLFLILIGISLLFTQSKWVPQVTQYIIERQDGTNIVSFCFLKSSASASFCFSYKNALAFALAASYSAVALDTYSTRRRSVSDNNRRSST